LGTPHRAGVAPGNLTWKRFSDMDDLRAEFLLESDVIFLNHGSYGATPKPVFDEYQRWQRRLEAQPVRFFAQELTGALADARHALAAFLNVGGDDLVFIPNATFGANLVARSLELEPGDEVLTCDHEYGACSNAWRFVLDRRGAGYVHQPLDLPVTDAESIADAIWAGVTPRTRVLYLSHITSPTALILPVAELCQRARAAGILTVIDGAHAPGQIDLNLRAIDADFYFGNCHKWLMSPKGAAFLYARPECQSLIQPLIVGWGWGPERNLDFGSTFLNATQFLGTNDLSAYLAVPAALAFRAAHDWPAQQARCHGLVQRFLTGMAHQTGLPPIYPLDSTSYAQMGAVLLPPVEPGALKDALYTDFRIEIPVTNWRDRHLLRLSAQG
jgi:isopenicillin-N epimerase